MKTLVYLPTFPQQPAEALKAHVIERFGGCTFYDAKGAWRMPDGSICAEPVQIVEVFTPSKSRAADQQWFLQECTHYGIAAKQDAVLVVHDDEPCFIETRMAA